MPAVSCRSRALTRRVSVLLAVALLGALFSFIVAQPASATGDLGLTNFSAMTVDPLTGRVFVSGDDKVVVLNADGSTLTSIAIPGAGGMAVDGTDLFIVEKAGAVARYDVRTLATTGRFTTGLSMRGPVAVVGDYVWFLSNGQYDNAGLHRLDPRTGEVTNRGTLWYVWGLESIPGSATRLLAYDMGLSPYSVYLLDLTVNPVATLGDVSHGVGSNLADVAATDKGTFITSSGAPYAFHEFALTPVNGVLPETGMVYEGTNYPVAVAYSSVAGGLVAGAASSSNKLFVSRLGVTQSAYTFSLPGDPAARGIGISGDGTRVYAITHTYQGPWTFSVYPLSAQLDSVSPTEVEQPGMLTLSGSGLASATSVRVDATSVPFSVTNASTLRVALPTMANGPHTVAVVTPWGTSDTKTFDVVSQPPAPIVSEVYPKIGTTAGGSNVTITGANFVDIQSVRIGDIPVDYSVTGTSSITLTAPAHAVGSAPVVVTTDHGTSNDDQTYSWFALTPTVQQLSPKTGSVAGGTQITILGNGFSFTSAVTVGGVPATSFDVQDDWTIHAVVPAHEAGATTVAVTTDGGTSSPSSASTFTYSSAVPALTALTPNHAATSGTPVQITGTSFFGVTSVTFGGAPVEFTVTSETSISAIAPAHAPGHVPVVVTNANGSSNAAEFAYTDLTTTGRPKIGAIDAASASAGAQPLTGDFNGDGVDDVFWYGAGPIADAIWFFEADGTHGSLPTSVKGTFKPIVGDFTGDGADDIFWYAPGTAADYLQNFTPNGSALTRIDVNGAFQPITGDFTGDGIDDIFWYSATAADWLWDFNTGGAHTNTSMAISGSYRPAVGDFTGDGVDDIFWYSPTAPDSIWDFNANGTRNTIAINMAGNYTPVAGDFTGDDVDDIFWFAPGTAADSIWDFQSGGGYTPYTVSRNDNAVPAVGDFTGGGVDDIVWGNGANSSVWFFSPVVRG